VRHTQRLKGRVHTQGPGASTMARKKTMNSYVPADTGETTSIAGGRALIRTDQFFDGSAPAVPTDPSDRTPAQGRTAPVGARSPAARQSAARRGAGRAARGPAAATRTTRHDGAGNPGKARLTCARLAVIRELISRIDGLRVPTLLLGVLTPGWRNLLIHVHLRHGPQHSAWHDALAVLDELHAALRQPPAGAAGACRLLQRVTSGLADSGLEPQLRAGLLSRLEAALSHQSSAGIAFSEVAPGSTATALGLVPVEHTAGACVGPGPDTAAVRHSWSVALERVSRLRAGDRLIATDAEARPLLLCVASPGDAGTSFCLVDSLGHALVQLSMTELADGLHTGSIVPLDEPGASGERGGQQVLETLSRRLAWQTAHDGLTGLMNRTEFERVLGEVLASPQRGARQHVLLHVDIDQFKVVNSTSGHAAGDALLQLFAARLRQGLGFARPTVARIGGDEFGVLLPDVDAEGARLAGELVLDLSRRERFAWNERQHAWTASIGIVLLDETVADVDTAMRCADSACQAAKEAGRNRVLEYELGDRRIMRRQSVMDWVTHLDEAIAGNRLALKSQRIVAVDATADALPHFEVLVTLDEDLGELMPAGEFIQAAETYHRVTALDRWVVARVLGWMAEHREHLSRIGALAINVSGHSINDESFVDFVTEQFAATQVPTSKVCFEITESAAIANLDNARAFMNRIRLLGCRFALDDFGTGLASYAYLRNLPVDYVKIDGIFVRGMKQNPADLAVVRSICEIGHCMGKKIIAEFVEDEQTLSHLREIGVDFAQGYGIERPCPLDELVS
jgi:diguanylate cyclase (GGDEF)-like protein